MANTFELISSVTVGSGGASSIDFTSIPATFTDLQVVFSIRNTRGSAGPGYLELKLNGSTSNFSRRDLERDWDSLGSVSSRSASDNYISFSIGIDAYTSSTFGNGQIYIPNYAGSAYKAISAQGVNENNGDSTTLDMFASLWSNTAAITSLGLVSSGNTFIQYSTAYLYGISKS